MVFPLICLKFMWAEFTTWILLYLFNAAILAYFIPCLVFFFFLACFSGTRSFLVEIIVTFSTKSSGHGNLLCVIF